MRKAVLLAAYGVSNPHARKALSGFESFCRDRLGSLPVRWAYTSERLRERIARERQKSDSVAKALLRLHHEKFDAVAIQPLQTIAGREFSEVRQAVEEVSRATGLLCSLGRPLLEADPCAVAKALKARIPAARENEECVIFMGHGARHPAESMYVDLNAAISRLDAKCFVCTLGSLLGVEETIPRLSSHRVWLVPLLSSVGNHVLRDMAGPDPGSWKSLLEAAGHECQPVIAGMIESRELGGIWLGHLEQALASLG